MKSEELPDSKLRELLKNSNPDQSFKVPEGYFESLSDKVMDSIHALPDFEKQALNQPYSVPAGYFEELPNLINDKILNSNRNQFSWKWLFNPLRLIPATFSILLFAGSYLYFTRTQTFDISNASFTVEEIKDSQYLQSFDDADLIDYLANQSDDNTTDEFDQYLIDHDIDISQLEKNL